MNNKAIILEAATEMQANDRWWEEFEYRRGVYWLTCTGELNPIYNYLTETSVEFRRKPKTITMTMLEPLAVTALGTSYSFNVKFRTEQDRDAALAAIRKAMEATK